MKVRDYMSDSVITANLRDGLHQTWERMRERHIRHMPVVDERERVVGIISDRDLRRPDGVDEGNTVHAYVLDDHLKVEQAMTGQPDTVDPNSPIGAALELFLAHGYGALPVCEDGGRVVGMLSSLDLLRAFKDSLARG